MSLVEWNPFRDMDVFSNNWSNLWENWPFRYLSGMSSPRVDVYQTENDVVLKAEIPGISKEDLNVYIDENSIRLSGHSKRNNEFKDEHILRSERYYGSFSRTIPLPVEVKSDHAKAEYKDGILTVTVPKAEPSKTKGRRIDIQ